MLKNTLFWLKKSILSPLCKTVFQNLKNTKGEKMILTQADGVRQEVSLTAPAEPPAPADPEEEEERVEDLPGEEE